MSNFYTDEPIGWISPDNLDDDDMDMPEGTDSIHNWDYFEPEPEDKADSWQSEYQNADTISAPEKIRQLLEMIRRQPWEITRAKSFYEQAVFMADYEDDAPIVDYMNYFPTYRDMTVLQMRSYFTIRKMWRQGKFPDVSLSYIFVYIYEILMQVGIDNPGDGLEILQELLAAYLPSIPKLGRYLNPWIRDYVVYYNLRDKFKEFFAEENMKDSCAELIKDYNKINGSQLLDIVCSMSKYDIRKSMLFKRQHDNSMDCIIAVLRAIIQNIEQQNHHHIETICFGKKVKRQITMFTNAVFYDPRPVKNAEIYVAPRHRYVCKGGLWTKDDYIVDPVYVRNLFGTILHETDCQLRTAFGVKPRLKSKSAAYNYQKLIHDAIDCWLEQKRKSEADQEAERRRVSIDFSKLEKIRNDAAVVMEKLDTSENATDSFIQDSSVEPIIPTGATKPVEPVEQAVTSPEQSFLILLLSGGDWNSFLHENHIPEGVMVEKINEKAMDEIGDIVLEDDVDGLHIIEDYREDIKELFELK